MIKTVENENIHERLCGNDWEMQLVHRTEFSRKYQTDLYGHNQKQIQKIFSNKNLKMSQLSVYLRRKTEENQPTFHKSTHPTPYKTTKNGARKRW